MQRYKVTSTAEVFPHNELQARYPNISFAPTLTQDILTLLGLEALPVDPAEVAEAAYQASIPKAVTMRQARLALLAAGKYAMVDPIIASLPEPNKSMAQIEWEYSNEVQRHNGFVDQIGPALGMTALQLDALFVAASAL